MIVHFFIITSSNKRSHGKKYVGRTSQQLDHRFEQILKHARHDKKSKGALNTAIRKFGEVSFRIDLLETFVSNDYACIEHRELELIIANDSIRNGWNSRGKRTTKRKTVIEPMKPLARWEKIRKLMRKNDWHIRKMTTYSQVEARHIMQQIKAEANQLARQLLRAEQALLAQRD